ncbi:FAD-dependent thymidylate synthase [Sphingomonas sp. RB3P16]|uniref:FAD-dependent thymidylate synthase n=1 Tax=Parasphingomonas frigoris TaxID=3096163 RepID=UPI002FC9E1C6
MSVRLIAISRPVIDDVPGTTELLAYMARVSSTANQNSHETGGKLLRSLVRRKEWSPLEMISLTMEIVTTRDIARQILRHRSFSFQEFSQRYAAVVEPPVLREARLQDHADRQNSIDTDDRGLAEEWVSQQAAANRATQAAYQWALDYGIAKEVARAVLPEGTTPSRLYMAGTLRSWLHYLDLRCDPKTQKEHRLLAAAASAIIATELPDLADLLPHPAIRAPVSV